MHWNFILKIAVHQISITNLHKGYFSLSNYFEKFATEDDRSNNKLSSSVHSITFHLLSNANRGQMTQYHHPRNTEAGNLDKFLLRGWKFSTSQRVSANVISSRRRWIIRQHSPVSNKILPRVTQQVSQRP